MSTPSPRRILTSRFAPDLTHATPRRLTRSEYDRLAEMGLFRGARVELVQGMVVRMAPIGPPHASIVDRLNEALLPRLVGKARVRIQQPLLAADESEPEPDVAVVPLGAYTAQHPDRALLVVEVAETALAYDRETKGPLYAASGVAEYWVVDVGARAIDVYSQPGAGGYAHTRRVGEGDAVSPIAFPEVVIAVADLLR